MKILIKKNEKFIISYINGSYSSKRSRSLFDESYQIKLQFQSSIHILDINNDDIFIDDYNDNYDQAMDASLVDQFNSTIDSFTKKEYFNEYEIKKINFLIEKDLIEII